MPEGGTEALAVVGSQARKTIVAVVVLVLLRSLQHDSPPVQPLATEVLAGINDPRAVRGHSFCDGAYVDWGWSRKPSRITLYSPVFVSRS
jgi:hypothetical protein